MAKITESTLENFKVTEGRATGNTTRLIDNAIQIIYSGKICVVKDHSKNSNCNRDLFVKILARLDREHSFRCLKDLRKVRIDYGGLEIELI